MGGTCAESPVPSVASEELTTGKRWSSLALVMQVLTNQLLTGNIHKSSFFKDLPNLPGGRPWNGCCGACPQPCTGLAGFHTGIIEALIP